MGVKNLWQILAPASRAVRLETLQGQVLAIDASIWLFQFLKAMRDSESGESLEGSHLLGFFRRICKLLFWGVKPIFVFDGAAPALKQATLAERRKRKEGKAVDVTRTARQLLSTQLQLASIDQSASSSIGLQPITIGIPKSKKTTARDPFALPNANDDWSSIVQERATRGAASRKNEDIRMPLLREELEYVSDNDAGEPSRSLSPPQAESSFVNNSSSRATPAQPSSSSSSSSFSAGNARYARDECDFLRHLAMLQSLESSRTSSSANQAQLDQDAAYAAQQFKSMPIEAQHELLTRLKDRSRAPSLRRVAQMIRASQSAMDFSKLQIQALMRRNFLTQTLHEATGFAGAGAEVTGASGKGAGGRVRRIASDRRRAYVLTKNENGIGFKFDAAKDQGPQILEANEIDRASLQVVASDRASFPLVGVDKVLEFVGEDAFGDEVQPSRQGGQQAGDDEDEDLLQFEPVVAVPLPPEVADMLDILPQQFANTFALGTEMLHSAVGWTAVELQQALMDCKARLDNVKLLLSTGDAEQVEHYENLTFWADFLDMLIARRERLDLEGAERTAAEMSATAAAAMLDSGTSRKRGRQVLAVDSDSESGALDGDVRPAKRIATEPHEMEDFLLASSSSDVMISHPVDGGFMAPVTSHCRRNSFSQSSGGHGGYAAPPPFRQSNMFAVLDDSDSEPDSELAPQHAHSQAHERVDLSHSINPFVDDHGVGIQDHMGDGMSNQDRISPITSPETSCSQPIPTAIDDASCSLLPDPLQVGVPTGPGDDSDDDAIFEPDTTTSRPKLTVSTATGAADDDAEADEEDMLSFEDVVHVEAPPVILGSVPNGHSGGGELEQLEEEASDDEFADVFDFGSSSFSRHQSPLPQPGHDHCPFESTHATTATPSPTSQSEPAHGDTQQSDRTSDDENELFMIAAAQRAEEDQFGKFLSDLQQRDLTSIQADLERERLSLEAKIRTERRDADVVTPEMVAETQALLRMFGIPYITAPAEAEAQCAWLAKEGLVDGVVSDDSDTFLFGAPIVYKNMFTNAKYVECYTAEGIEQALQLDVSSLIQLAYLLGSDYTPGIQGIGAVLAMEALVAFPGGLQEFAEWARDPQSSAAVPNNPQATATRKKLKRVAANVPNHFPDPAVEQAYLQPVVDNSREPYTWGVPDVSGIKQLLWERLQWHPDKTESTLNPVIAEYNKAKAGRGQRQATLFGFGFTGYIPNSKARTKGITSERMTKAIEAKRSQKTGSTVTEGAKGKSKSKAGPKKARKDAVAKKGRQMVPKKAASSVSDSESLLSGSESESESNGLSDAGSDNSESE